MRSNHILVLSVLIIFSFLNGCEKENEAKENKQIESVPNAPTSMTASPVSNSQINLTWKDNSNDENGFKIERATGNSTNFLEISTLSANSSSFQNTGLSSSTTYYYKVYAFNNTGKSGYASANATTSAPPVIIPSPPSNLAATPVSDSKINLSWTDNSNNEDGFKIERAPGGTSTFSEIATVTANSITYQNTGLSVSNSYVYRICSYNTAGNSTYSNTAPATTLAYSPPSISVPSTSTGSFKVTITYAEWPTLQSNWDQYELEESTTSVSAGFAVIHTATTHASPYEVNLTRNPGTYHYRARIRKNTPVGYSQYSNVGTVVVTAPERSITLINNSPTTVRLKEIVQVKVATTSNGVYTRTDLLTNDPARCLSLPGQSIAQGQSRKFVITIGSNYYVYIGMGIWDLDNFFCAYPNNWFKCTYFTTPNYETFYVWKVITVTDHTSGNWNWTLSGSYLDGTLRVTPSGSSSIYFNRTSNNPIP